MPFRTRSPVCIALVLAVAAGPLRAQVLSLEAARTRALQLSPALQASREAAFAAAGRARQAGAFPNPVLTYAREQTSRAGRTSWQNIGLIEQRLDFGGARGARADAAGLRREAADASTGSLEAELLFEVTRAYALAVAADHRAAQASQAAEAFTRAQRVSAERFAEGDLSGYAHRRIGLEAARYGLLRAEALRARHEARLTLATWLAASADSLAALEVTLEDSIVLPPLTLPLDSLRTLAFHTRADLRAAGRERDASAADARAAGREARPIPLAGLGFKNERGPGDPSPASGFVVQLSLPLPLWDARRGAVEAFAAEGRQRGAEVEVVRHRIAREVELAWVSARAAELQLITLRPQLGAEAAAALRAAETAYGEGEITLVEWLDAVRAYQEAEASFAALQAEYIIQRAALERAVGTGLN